MLSGAGDVGVVLDIVMDILRRIVDGHAPELAVCSSLLSPLHASVSAYVVADPLARSARVTLAPPDLGRLAIEALRSGLAPFVPALLKRVTRDPRPVAATCAALATTPGGLGGATLLRERLGCRAVAEVPLHEVEPDRSSGPRPLVRLVAVAGTSGFDERDLALLDHLRGPLSLLVGLQGSSHGADPPGTDTGSPAHEVPLTPPTSAASAVGQDQVLTTREAQVLALVAEGLLARTVASRLEVSPRTVHKHLGNAYQKLGVHDRLLAVRQAQVRGLIPGGQVDPVPADGRSMVLRW